MTIVAVETTELVSLSASEAQRLTQRIKLVASSVRDSLAKLRDLVEEARGTDAWQVLGFHSWTAYLADTLGSEPMRLDREERQELVGYLAGEGLSTRAIAPIVGVSQMQVVRDVQKPAETNVSPAPAFTPVSDTHHEFPKGDMWSPDESFTDSTAAPVVMVNTETGEVTDPTPVPVITETTVTEKTRTVIGLDGKTYTPEARLKQRKPITDAARDAGWELRKAVERIQRLTDDDRFTRYKDDVMSLLLPHLDFAIEAIAGLSTSEEN